MEGLAERLATALVHEPTSGQRRAMDALSRLVATPKARATLVLKGYAGTGKTTLVGALVKVLTQLNRPLVLLAPTGRAAKVLSAYAGRPASTIHRRIYRSAGDRGDELGRMTLSPNRDRRTLYIVDEASMIGRGEGAFERDLLADLFAYVFTSSNNKLLLIGDPAQLPPVGSAFSPALEVRTLAEYGLLAGSLEMTDVVRQEEASGILANATELRHLLPRMPETVNVPSGDAPPNTERIIPRFLMGFADVVRVEGYDLQDALEDAYAREGDEQVCLICRSNKRAYQYSQEVRARIHGFEEELEANDRLMVVKNDYFWTTRNEEAKAGFGLIANGEQLKVLYVQDVEERHGLRFANLTVAWWDGEVDRELDVKVLLDTLATPGAAMPGTRMRAFGQSVLQEIEAPTKAERFRLFRMDPYVNALQVKYAYAVTCHKAQGGQWKRVFVDQGYVTEEMIDREYVRWLYTALTRATDKLYLLNFHPRFYGEE